MSLIDDDNGPWIFTIILVICFFSAIIIAVVTDHQEKMLKIQVGAATQQSINRMTKPE